MASSRPSSHGVDWMDVAETVRAFQEHNRVTITMGLVLTESKGLPDILVDAQAWERSAKPTDPKLLASANKTCSVSNIRTLEAVIFQLLYALDAQLALRELKEAYENG